MAQVPISPDIQKSYRDTLQIPDSPSFIDTRIPIQPVAVIAQTSVAELAQFQKITDGTDTLEVNTDGSLNTHERTDFVTLPSSSNGVFGTVPAGKKWIVVFYSVYSHTTNQTYLELGTAVVGSSLLAGVSNQSSCKIVMTAGQTADFTRPSASDRAVITYYEVDA
jgi:hypothetical protein